MFEFLMKVSDTLNFFGFRKDCKKVFMLAQWIKTQDVPDFITKMDEDR